MSDERFKIYVEQLRSGNTENIQEVFTSDFLDVKEKDLSFSKPITVQGQAYLADEELILHLDIQATATLPCAICNDPAEVPISVKDFYHAVPLDDIKGAVYDFREILRETILLEVPNITECHQGKCPQRQPLKKYFKKESNPEVKEDDEGYRPFADLDFNFKDK